MPPYNLTFMDNSTGITGIVTGIVDNSGSTFWGVLLIFFWMILFVLFRSNGTSNAFVGSSFIIAILAGLGFGYGALGPWQLVFPITMLVASIIVKVWGDG